MTSVTTADRRHTTAVSGDRATNSPPGTSTEPTAGCLVAVAMLNASARAAEVRALDAAHVVPLPVLNQSALADFVARVRPDLVVLDVGLCQSPVVDVLAWLQLAGVPAIILVGSLPDAAGRAALLRAGADDCILAPYLVDELVARVLAVLRRTRRPQRTGDAGGALVRGSLRMDLDRHVVEVNGRVVALTLLEFRLLAYLFRHPGIALSRQRLLFDVWGHTVGGADTVTVHIRRLRVKIEPVASRPSCIQTVRGVGYRFAASGSN